MSRPVSRRPVSRRTVLLVAGAGVLTAAVPVLSRAFDPADPPGAPPAELLAALPDPEDARRIGGLWLDGRSGDPSAAALAGRLSGRLRRHGWRPGDPVATLRSALAESIRSDFAGDDVVDVHRWQLARTTAELCALAALA